MREVRMDSDEAIVKEHPILFSTEMVRAILEGRKTQTRRIPTPFNSTIDGPTCNLELWKTLDWSTAFVDPGPSPAGNPGPYWKVKSSLGTTQRVYCRYQVGDILWGKETVAIENWTREFGEPKIPTDRPHFYHKGDGSEWDGDYWLFPHYKATDPTPELVYEDGPGEDPQCKWTPSIHMPRWASRLTRKVVSLRAERLQQISELDCEAEVGAAPHSLGNFSYVAFHELWDRINGKRGFGWETNPAVWAIGFPKHNES